MSPQNQFAEAMAEMIVCRTSVELQGYVYVSDHDTGNEDGSDQSLHVGEKKRRLTFDQVKTLEKSFELRNKLDPVRKMQLAKALGLQPRQISVWFQNRRARWKTKQLEKDFDALKQEYDTLKRNYDILLQQNTQFKAEVQQQGTELEKKNGSGKCRASEIESQKKSQNSVPEALNSSMDLSVKSEICVKCTEQQQHDYYSASTKEQEAECCRIMSGAAGSFFDVDSPRTMEISESTGVPQKAVAAAQTFSSVLVAEGSLGPGEQVTTNGLETPLQGLHDWYCQPKVAVDQITAEETKCSLFYSLEEQSAVMLCEYWQTR